MSIILVQPWATGAGEIPAVYLPARLILAVAYPGALRSSRLRGISPYESLLNCIYAKPPGD
jgi:hypothetical protein